VLADKTLGIVGKRVAPYADQRFASCIRT